MKHSSFQCQREAARGSHEMLVNPEQPVTSPAQLQLWGDVGMEFVALPVFQMSLGIGILTLCLMTF